VTRIRLLRDGAIGRIVLARPEKKNALDRQAAEELFAALAQLEGDATIRAIHLAADGDDFCAGADLEALERTLDAGTEVHRQDAEALGRVFLAIRALMKPVVCSVRGRALAGEANLPKYTPDIALRSIDGHLTRTGTQVMAWYRLAAQAWSFRSDSQREVLIRQIAAQLGELQGRWLHIRVTTRPYPVHMWAESFDNNALGRLPDVPGALGWDGFLEGEQRHLMGLSMSDKEVFLGIEVSGRSMLDRWVEKAAPVLGKVAPAAVRAELSALASEVGHLDELVAGSGLDAVPATGDDVAWLMHRSCSLGLPAPRTIAATNGSRWETEDLAAFTDGVDMFQEPYAPTVRVVGRLRSATVQRNVAVLTVGLMDGLRIPEVDDPWMQHSDRLPFPVEWSARIYVRKPEEVTGELQRQMGKVRSQIRHYTHDHDLDPPMSLARQADRVLEIEDELTSGLTQLNTRLYGWWRIAVAGKDEAEALTRAQQVLDLYSPKVQVEHPEAQYRYAREFIPGEPLASTAYRRRGSVTWAARDRSITSGAMPGIRCPERSAPRPRTHPRSSDCSSARTRWASWAG